MTLTLGGCQKNHGMTATKLSAPQASVDFNRIAWTPVQGAIAYVVSSNGQEIKVEDGLWLDLMQHFGSGTFYAKVKACGDGISSKDSEWSNEVTVTASSFAAPLVLPDDYSSISSHPRLFLPKGEETKVFDGFGVIGNNYLKKAYDFIRSQAEAIISSPVISRSWSGSMLYVAREGLRRIFYLSYMGRVTGDGRYSDRAREELLSLCSFDDWNPSHYLDVGEASLAVAIGYDWLYDKLSEADRAKIWDAVKTKSFANDLARQITSSNNWNPVCNGGTVIAALSLYENDPLLCSSIINDAGHNLHFGLPCYGPEGAYPEGYTYWGYGTAYYLLVMDAFESALGFETGIDKTTGFMRSARYRQFMSTPSYGCFAYSDAGTEAELCSSQAWFAAKTGDPTYIWETKRMIDADKFVFSANEDRFLPMLLIRAAGFPFSGYEIPSQQSFYASGNQEVYVYREGWNSVGHAYLGVKGGCPIDSHAHMDAGMFYYENKGVRWACDCGNQSYGSIQSMLSDRSQNGQCWRVFRYGPQGHNILQFGAGNQKVDARAAIIERYDSPDKKGCAVDLDRMYSLQASSVRRSVWLDASENLAVQDDIKGVKEDCELRWNMITGAVAKIAGNSIRLTSNDHSAELTCNVPGAVAYAVTATTGENFDAPNTGKMRVGYKIPVVKGGDYNIEIKLSVIE